MSVVSTRKVSPTSSRSADPAELMQLTIARRGACLVELGDEPDPGRAALLWLLTPGQLRRLGD